MDKTLLTQLNMLKTVEPDKGFARRTRKKILAQKGGVFSMPFPRVIIAGSLSFALLFLALIVPAIIPGPRVPAALSADAINKEYDNLSINIQLKNLTYDQSAEQTINSAINEVATSKGKHLNTNVLKSESADVQNSTSTEMDVDAMLNKVIN